ncbi:hypothetical protein P168DRAFT_326904 [Aspergillus campestris IBT 28561]|uniref:Uncharacterized protein n=1 Tax=Aspergillus campestris (strain IBT 28561) TaxID=1392248 RepID=A0A2I1D5P9_ASPC2|nr:uncharacterized protein P168DRAFT_326904 [Aspergillus campestris IBT 28561]PKY05201.1 hypothetical protein P168DRAFT_326904 [Aspergillus campestris IBT 28561]
MRRHTRRAAYSDSDSEYSESDLSMELPSPNRHAHYRRRSVSRHRFHSPEHKTTSFLAPIQQDVHLHRSASTGTRRRHDRASPVNVTVDIKNDSRNRSNLKGTNKARKETQEYVNPYESDEDEAVLRNHHRRRHHGANISREASPRQPARDFDLVIEQRMLEHNDARQDLELLRQQQEIQRLERELARHREQRDPHQETRLLKEEEDWYEDEISDRLRRLEKFEKKQRMEEEQRHVEHRYKLRKYEEEQRRAAEEEEVRVKMREEKLRDLQRKMEEEEERERIKKEIRDEEARQLLEEQEKQRKEAAMKQAVIEEYQLTEERRKNAMRDMQKQQDEAFKQRLRVEYGLSEEKIEELLKQKNKDEKKSKEKGKDKDKDKDDKDDDKEKKGKGKQIEHQRPTWIKVHRDHLLPETLISYNLPWDFDDLDGNYLIIKEYIPEDLQDELFAHTKRIRQGRLVSQTSSSQTELRVNDRRKDKMYLVRKKSPNRRAWIFT